MGLQFVIKANATAAIESALGSIAPQCEVFPMGASCFGVSIPTKIIDSIGEQAVETRLAVLEHFDLWAGTWKKPE